jgi:hypothetical protein
MRQLFMRVSNRAKCLLAGLLLFGSFALAQQPTVTDSKQGFPCFKHHGRLTAYSNGIATKIWLIGTNRVVAAELPAKLFEDLARYLDPMPPDNFGTIFGDFEICPLEPDTPGAMRHVQVMKAEKLVVASAYDGSRPAFKLMSTWPEKAGGKAP